MKKKPRLSESTVKAIIFDFGDVICFWDDKVWSDEYVTSQGLNPEELRNLMYEYMRHGGEGKYHSFQDFFDRHPHDSKIQGEIAARLYEMREKTATIDTGLVSLITNLKPHYKIGLLSNYTQGLEGFLVDRFHIHHLFDAVVSSYTIRIRKPAMDAYHYVARELSEQTEHCLFVDDKETNINGAREAGMQAIQFVGINDLVESLDQKFGIRAL